jgi:3-oxoadipate enol-lactonase
VTAIVLSGSLGSTVAIWESQVPALAGHEIVPVEHPGHGGAPVVEVRDVADLARFVLGQVTAERFAFVGVSLGGAVAMRLALDAPDRVETLVLACTSARFAPPELWQERAALVRSEGVEAVVDAALERWFTPAFRDVPRYREMFVSTDREGYARCCDALARWDAREEIAAIAVPTLVVSGADDPAAPPEHGELIAARIPGARHEVIAGGRHLATVERADEFNRVLREHLG